MNTASTPHAPPDGDETAVRALLSQMNEAWERGDARAYGALFTEDADYVVFDGARLRGRAENAALHQQLFDTILGGTRLRGEVESVAFVSEDVAIVHSSGGVLWPWQREINVRASSRQTLVLVKHDGRWRIRAFQNTRIRPVPPLTPGSLLVRLFQAWVRLRVALSGGQ